MLVCRGIGQAGIATVGDKLNSLLTCFSLIGSQPVVGISHYQLYTDGKEFFFKLIVMLGSIFWLVG